MQEINFQQIEKKWQDRWEKEKVFKTEENSKKEKCYVLEMFPYPSGSGLHMGHAWNYSIGDIYARFKKMQGFNVLHPMGYDALGLPAENAAIKDKTHPEEYTKKSIKSFTKQFKKLGISYDWDRLLTTSSPEYYKWDQWIFLKMFEKGLAYQKTSAVNWCPECNTVLANEQVQDGKCWRHDKTKVEIKQLKQWFLKTTKYADKLLKGHKKLDWPKRTIAMQKNWIGKSQGTEIDFEINGNTWPIFTTRPDTIFGVTFMVVSAQHQKLMELVTPKQEKEVKEFLKKLKSVSEKDIGDLEKEGVFTGSYAINPATKEKIPIWAGNFVVADYASGMVMAVPAHDQRDFEFAKKYDIKLREVIMPTFWERHKEAKTRKTVSAVVHRKRDDKYLILKWKIKGWITQPIGGIEEGEEVGAAAEREVFEETGYKTKFIKKLGGEIESNFYADHKKIHMNRIDQAVLLELTQEEPEEVDEKEKALHEPEWMSYEELMNNITHEYNKIGFQRYKEGEKAFTESGILINSKQFNELNNQEAKKQITNWLIKNKKAKTVINYKLRDWGISRQRYWGTPIPIIHCDSCGAIPVPEKDLPIKLPHDVKFGKGNPLETATNWINVKCPKCNGPAKRETDTMDTFANSSWYFLRYCDPNNNKEIFDKKKVKDFCPVDLYIGGAEHACMHLIYARFYTMFLQDLGLVEFDEFATRLFHQGMLNAEGGEKMSKSKGNVVLPEVISDKYGMDTARYFLCSLASPDKDIEWSERGINGSLRFIKKIIKIYTEVKQGKDSEKMTIKLNTTIKEITEQIEKLEYRKTSIKLKELFETIEKEKEVSKETLEKSLKLLSPVCPHITEELWEKLGNKDFIAKANWPKAKEINIKQKKQDLTEKIINDLKPIIEKHKEKKQIYLYAIPPEKPKINTEKIQKAFNKKVTLYSVKDNNVHDPENKKKKAKPGKPSFYLE